MGRRSGMRSDLAELAFFVYFFGQLQKSKSQSRLERQCQTQVSKSKLKALKNVMKILFL